MKIAAQLYTVRDLVRTPEGLRATLGKLKEIGYAGAQFSAVECMNGDSPAVTARQARAMLDELGMACCATHRPMDRLMAHTAEEIDFHLQMGCRLVGIGSPGPAYAMESIDDWHRLAEDITRLSAAFGEHGITFAYHNHALEWQRLGPKGVWPFGILVEETPEEVHFIVDTYWVAVAGLDPAHLLRSLAGRISVIHAKDLLPHEWSIRDVPVGEGNLEWKPILDACRQGGTEWIAVEQDNCWRDHLDSLASSHRYLAAHI